MSTSKSAHLFLILGLDFLEFSKSTKSDARKRHPFENFELSISARPAIPASQPCQPAKVPTYIILGLDFLEFSESTKSDARKRPPFENFELSISASPASQPCQPANAHTLYHSKTGFYRIQRVNQKRCPKATPL